MKQILTLLLLLFSLTLSAQTVDVVGPKKKPQTTAPAKPKPATPAAKPQPKQNPKTKSKPQSKQPTISTPTGYENGHGYVDLGLSVKWATMNVGASSPTDYGGYYAWGETRTKSDYSWRTYFDSVSRSNEKFHNSNSDFYKYAANKKTTLDLSDDAAHVNWGGSWRMPSRAELDELREKCTWTWTTQNGTKGYRVSSKRNGNSIFLPAAGAISGNSNFDANFGYYRSSSLCTGSQDNEWTLFFHSDLVDRPFGHDREYGFSVRAVCK